MATTSPNEWQGTTTTCSALLHHTSEASIAVPLLYVTNLGDSQIMVIRPKADQVIYKTKEQWHWFDCPRQLGTNSPDKPTTNAVMQKVELEEGDVVLAMSDGVTDNLWEHEILHNVIDSIRSQGPGFKNQSSTPTPTKDEQNPMLFVAKQLVGAARVIAEDPFAESPFMERAVEEGLALEGGEYLVTQRSSFPRVTLSQGSSTTSALSQPSASGGLGDTCFLKWTDDQRLAQMALVGSRTKLGTLQFSPIYCFAIKAMTTNAR